jgi:hypothetical protein
VIGFSGGSIEALVEPHELSGPTESSSWIRFMGDQFTMTDLAPVPSILRVRQGDNAAALELALAPGQTTDVDVRLSAEVPVTGRVMDRATGEPLPEASVSVTDETHSSQVMPGGKWALKLLPGPHTLGLWGWSYKSRDVPVIVGNEPLNVGDIALEREPSGGGVGIRWAQEGLAEAAIDHVVPAGPAALAGLRSGDIVVAVNGEPVERAGDASDLIRGPIGAPVAITVRRNGAELTVQIVRADLDTLTARSP